MADALADVVLTRSADGQALCYLFGTGGIYTQYCFGDANRTLDHPFGFFFATARHVAPLEQLT